MKVRLTPSNLNGSVCSPPSKSFAHRLIICAYLSGEKIKINNVGESKDVYATLNALKSIGLKYSLIDGNVIVEKGKCDFNNQIVIDCDESGSTMRFLMPIVSALGIKSTFSGRGRLLSRPIEKLTSSLNQHNANIDGFNLNGKLESGEFLIDASISSQYISGLLFALPLLDGDSSIRFTSTAVSLGYIDITLEVLKKFNIQIEKTDYGYFVKGNQKYSLGNNSEITTEGDFSGSAFLLSAGAIANEVKVSGLNNFSSQGDREILSVLEKFGAKLKVEKDSIIIKSGELKSISYDCENIPDLVQIISVVSAFASGVTTLKNVQRLKLKESDRIEAIIEMLTKSGIQASFDGKDLTIQGGKPKGANFDGGNDHRTVMSQSILAFYAQGQSTINGAEAIEKSYPRFFEDVSRIGGKVDVII